MNSIKNICVFASASNIVDRIYFNAAYELGKLIAKNNYDLVYGASTLGLMGEVVSGARSVGCHITGVMPEKLYNYGISSGDCTKFILTKGMRERKAKMDELSQAVIALAGGYGTLDELCEMIVLKQLGYHLKPIVILNTNGFYDDLISFFNNLINKKFASDNSDTIYYVANSPNDAIGYINNYSFVSHDYLSDKLYR